MYCVANNQPYSVECVAAINEAASYMLHLSSVYLSTAYGFNDKSGMPSFAVFFEHQADARRAKAYDLLRHLRRHEGRICLAVYKKPDMRELSTPVKVLTEVLEMERSLTVIMRNLKAVASDDGEMDLLNFLADYNKHNRCEDYLACQLSYQKMVEEREQKRAQTEEPSSSSGAMN